MRTLAVEGGSSSDTVKKTIERGPDSEFGSLLVALVLETNHPIGQCKIGSPDTDGVAELDITLNPDYWGNGYGKEL